MKFDLSPITANSLAGKMLEMSYVDFTKLVEKKGISEIYEKIDLEIAQKEELAKDAKRLIEKEIKKAKLASGNLRKLTTDYMLEHNIDKVTGESIKSISLQLPKTVKKTITDKQIKKGRSYISLSELSKDDLIQMLEDKGVKTRTITKEVEVTTEPNIRVLRR